MLQNRYQLQVQPVIVVFCVANFEDVPEGHPILLQISKMERYAKPLVFFVKHSILDVCGSPRYGRLYVFLN